jgi:porphobilinogen deaminase
MTQRRSNTDIYEKSKNANLEQKSAFAEHCPDTFLHPKCALCVHKDIPDDLKEIIECWTELPESVRESIKILVRSAKQ